MGRKKGKQSGHHASKAANALFWKEHIQDHVVSHSSSSQQCQLLQQPRRTYPKPRPKIQTIGSLQTLLRMNQQRQHSSMNIFGSSHDSHYGYIFTNTINTTTNDDEIQYNSNLDDTCRKVPTLLELALMSLGKNLDVYIDHYGEKLLYQIFSNLLPTNVLSYLSLLVRSSNDSIFQFYLFYHHHHHYQTRQNYNLLIRCSTLSPKIHSILQKYLLNNNDMNDGNIETRHNKVRIDDEREYDDWEERDIMHENDYNNIPKEEQTQRNNHDSDIVCVDKRTFLFESLKRLELHHWNNSLSTLILLLKQCPNLTHLSLSSLEIPNTNEIMMWWTQILNHLPNKSLVVLDLTNCSWMSPSLLHNSSLVDRQRQQQHTNVLWKNDEKEEDDDNVNRSFPNLEYIYLYGCPDSCFYKLFQKNIGPKPRLSFDEKIDKPLRLQPYSCILKNYQL